MGSPCLVLPFGEYFQYVVDECPGRKPTVTTLQEQARALGDPTRHRIFRYIVDADRAVDVAELTEHFGLNHNAVRQHLAKLTAADLLVSGTVPSKGRGRPRLCYRVAPAVEARWGVESPYERLSTLLVEMLRSGEAAEEVGRRAGVRSDPDAAADPIETLVEEMARHGFDPVVTRDGDEVEVTLRSCPFASAAVRDPGTVCGIHLGIARGVADLVGGMVVDELVPHDPRRAGCRLRVHLEARE